jgi:L-lactate dehydrogenase (cytochrome)
MTEGDTAPVAAPPPSFANFQNEIYLNGTVGVRPELPLEPAELERAAEQAMSAEAFGYVAGSAGTESTARANRAAFDRWRIVPRFLRDVSARELSREIFGVRWPAPVGLAPVGVQGIVHSEAELAVARAAAGLGLTQVLSTVSSYTLEDVAAAGAAAGQGQRWFQLYWPRDRDVAASLLDRAAAAGYGALVVTLDTFILAWRPRDLARAYLPFLSRLGLANYESDPAFCKGLGQSPDADDSATVLHWQAMFGDPSNTWDDLEWLRGRWEGPLLLKGVLHPDDARRAADCGVDGLIVSNHGGRQIDGSIGALEALPDVVAAVGHTMPVLFDSGVRTGSDVMKALALGARAVFVGRPYVYGLALAGEDGVRHVLRCLLAELELTMALSGCASLADIGPELVRRTPV